MAHTDTLDIKELPDTIQGSIVYNPFDPSDRKDVFLQYSSGKSLDFYVHDLPEDVEWTVMLNGRHVLPEGMFLTFPKPGDHIIASPVPEGGGDGDGKAMLMMVATLALSFAAPYLATAWLGKSAVGTLAHSLATAGINLAGGLLIAAMMPSPESGNDTSDAFGIDGPKNTSTEGVPYPILYGEHGFGGNYIDLYTENSTDERGEAIQILSGRVLVSEGPIDSISEFLINDQALENYEGVQTDFRLGNDSQTVSPWFNGTTTLINQNRQLETNWQTYTTSQEVDRIRLDVAAPAGIFISTKRGKKNYHTVEMEMQYSLAGQNEWQTIPDTLIQDNRSSAVRRTYWTPDLDEAVYDVRWRRVSEDSTLDTVSDTVILTDVGEYVAEKVSLPYVAWAGFRTRLTGQLTSVPSFTGVARGIVMPIYDHRGVMISQSWSNNPADILLDIYLNPRYGGATEIERIDFAAHSEWRDYCAENDLTFNGIFYEGQNLDEAMKAVYIAGRAQRVSSGSKISVAIDKPTGVSMMFGAGNIRKDSLSITYLPFADRVNDIEIAFNDEEDKYRRRVVRITNDEALARGEELMPATIELKGVTNHARARREGVFRMNYNRLITRTAEWESPLEAIGCAVGDVVALQAEMMGWGIGGRILKGSTATQIKLDREITFETGVNYRVLIHQNVRTLASVNVLSQSGNIITLDTPVTEDILSSLHVQSTGVEYGITRKIDNTTLILAESAIGAGLATAGEVDIRVHDRIDEADVVNFADQGVPPTTDTITLTSPLVDVPLDYANYIFGSVTSTNRQFRVKTISRPAEGFVNLTGVEYLEAIYDDSASDTVTSSPPSSVSHVTNLEIESQLTTVEGGFASSVSVGWSIGPTGLYVGAEVQVSVNGDRFKTVGRTSGTGFSFSAEAGDSVIVRVLAIDFTTDTPMGPQNAPTASITVAGVSDIPDTPTGLAAVAGVSAITLGWNQNDEVDLRHYEIIEKTNTTAPGAGASPSFVASGTVFVRTGLASEITRHYWIRAVDFSGNKSEWSARATATTLTYAQTEDLPIVPANLSLTTEVIADGRSRVTASWDASSGVTEYEVQFLVLGAPTSFMTTQTSYSFEVPPNIEVSARVKSLGIFNVFSAYTAYETITSAKDVVPPPQVVGLTALSGIRQVFLNWTNSPSTDLSRYDVFYNSTGTAPGPTTSTNLQVNASFTSIAGLTAGTTYSFWVRAVDTSGNAGDWSAVASAQAMAPDYDIQPTLDEIARVEGIADDIRVDHDALALDFTNATNAFQADLGNLSDDLDALEGNLTTVTADLSEVYDSGTGQVKGSALSGYYTIADADSAISAAIDSFSASILTPGGQIKATALTAYYTAVETDSAVAAMRTTLRSEIGAQSIVSDFQNDGLFWSSASYGDPEDKPDLTAPVSFIVDAGLGKIARIEAPQASNVTISPKSYIQNLEGVNRRVTVRARHNGAFAGGSEDALRFVARYVAADYLSAGSNLVNTALTFTVADEVEEFTLDWVDDGLHPLLTVGFAVVSSIFGTSGPSIDIISMDLENLTAVNQVAADLEVNYYTATEVDGAISGSLTTFESTFLTPTGQIKADVLTNYYTSADTDTAIAGQISTFETDVITPGYQALSGSITDIKALEASALTGTVMGTLMDQLAVDAGGTSATITAQGNAISTLEGVAEASYVIKAQAGGAVSLIDLVAADDGVTPPTSIIQLNADDIIANGTVSTDKLMVGLGRNLLENSNWRASTDGWFLRPANGNAGANTTFSIRPAGDPYAGVGQPTGMLFQDSADADGFRDIESRPVIDVDGTTAAGYPVAPGDVIEGSVYLSAHRCTGEVRIRWFNDTGGTISFSYIGQLTDNTGSDSNPDLWPRIGGRATAPAGAVSAAIHIRKLGTNSGANSYLFVHKPQLLESHAAAVTLAPYSPPGTTVINGGQIQTQTITADQIAANTITAGQLAADTITANEIEAGTITGDLLDATNIITDTAQIGSGVIKSANIGELEVTNANIANLTVGTTKITGNAVTGAAAADGDSSGTAEADGWTTVAEVTVTTDGGFTFVAQAAASTTSGPGGGAGAPGSGRVRLQVNGTTEFETSDYGSEEVPILVVSTSTALTTTLRLQSKKTAGDGNFDVEGTVFGMELKR